MWCQEYYILNLRTGQPVFINLCIQFFDGVITLYDTSEIAERIISAIKRDGRTVNAVLSESGLSKNVIVNLKTGSQLAANKIAVLADTLHCSVDYLLGRTDVMEVGRIEHVTDQLPENEQLLLDYFRLCNEHGKRAIIGKAAEMSGMANAGDGPSGADAAGMEKP